MEEFTLYVSVLTFLEVVYFAVLITMDLHGKKDSKNSDEETLDVSGMNDDIEEPVAISESMQNNESAGITYTEQSDENGMRVFSPSGNNPPVDEESETPEPEETPLPSQTTSEWLNEENGYYMENTDPEYQLSLEAEDYINQLNQKHNQRKIEKKNVIDNL